MILLEGELMRANSDVGIVTVNLVLVHEYMCALNKEHLEKLHIFIRFIKYFDKIV